MTPEANKPATTHDTPTPQNRVTKNIANSIKPMDNTLAKTVHEIRSLTTTNIKTVLKHNPVNQDIILKPPDVFAKQQLYTSWYS